MEKVLLVEKFFNERPGIFWASFSENWWLKLYMSQYVNITGYHVNVTQIDTMGNIAHAKIFAI